MRPSLGLSKQGGELGEGELEVPIDQVVGPIVLGRAAHVHPVLIIFCFLAGGAVLGIPGVILAVPMALAVKAALATLYGEEPD